MTASKGAGTPKASSKTVSPALSTDALEDNNDHSKRQITPDIIKVGNLILIFYIHFNVS